MPKYSKRCVSKQTSEPDKPKKMSKNMKILASNAKAPVKSRRTAEIGKFSGVEDENPESIDSGYGESQPRVNHRYPTRERIAAQVARARIAAQATQNNHRKQTTSSSAKPAKPRRSNYPPDPPDVDKENDGSAANGAQSRQGTSSNKRRLSGFPVSQPASQHPRTPEDSNSIQDGLSQCSSADWIEHIRWLQARRDIGLWIECTRKGCGKWRYVEEYHDPLDVPKIWFCEMNTDATFADCSIPQEEISEAEVRFYIENAYNAGSIVWAKVTGFPWWPAMVDDCPDLLKYWDIHGSSIVPCKYHAKFFNEMKIAWIPVRNLKPYAENPRNTFLKKTVFRNKDYSQELDAACELANQALPLSLLQRLKRFSWATQISAGLLEEDESLSTVEGPAKKKKSTNISTIDPKAADNTVASPLSSSTKKRPRNKNAKKKVTRNTKTNVTENVIGKKTLNVRSRIINIETETATNTKPLTSQRTGVPKQFTFNVPISDSASQSSSCRDKASFLEPNELFKSNSIDRSEVDHSKVVDAPVPSTATNSTASTCEEPKRTEEAHNPRRTKRITRADIAALAQEIRNTRPLYAQRARNARRATSQIATTSNPSIALHSRELSLPVQSDEKLGRSSIDFRSSVASVDIEPTVSDREDRGEFSTNDIFASGAYRNEVSVGTEEPVASPWEPFEIDLTDSSTDFEGFNDRRESPESPNRAETRNNTGLFDPTLASTSNGLGGSCGSFKSCGSIGSLALSSGPEWPEIADRCPSHCGLCTLSVHLEDSDSSVNAANVSANKDHEKFFANDIFAAITPRPEARHGRSPSRESGISSLRKNSASVGGGSSRSDAESEINFSPGGSEINFSPGGSEINFSPGGSEINFSPGGSEINFSPDGSEIIFSLDGSESNFPADRSGIKFPAGGSETNFSADRSEINFCAARDESTSSSNEPIFVDLTDSSTDFEGYYDRREYPDYPNHEKTRADPRSFDPSLASTSYGFGPLNTARRFSAFESSKAFGSAARPSWPERDDKPERRSNISGWRASSVDFQVSGPSALANALPKQDYPNRANRAASWSSREPASSKYVLNMEDYSLLDILTRSRSSVSDQSSGTVVPSSCPEMDEVFELLPRFPGLSDRRRDLNTSTYSLPRDVNFGSPARSSSNQLFKVITIDD